jgi:hypothetical protein
MLADVGGDELVVVAADLEDAALGAGVAVGGV